MDQVAVTGALRKLRESKFPTREALRRASGIHLPTIIETEEGRNLPGIKIIERWVTACSTTLSQFFKDLEESPDLGKDKTQIVVRRANKKKHEELEDILNAGGDAADWIAGNITVFHNDHVRKRR